MKINRIKANKNNPRKIDKYALEKLKQSIEDFPKMMELRPIIVDAYGTILGGNMRYRAIKELGYQEIPDSWVRYAEDLTEEEKKRFINADNIGYGTWDMNVFNENFDLDEVNEWSPFKFPPPESVGLPTPEDYLPNGGEQVDDIDMEVDERDGIKIVCPKCGWEWTR